ncbi:carboxypeptidase-like regulatory domain-containing protein [Rhodopirellula halodulae]|uniref:carboxypeptidase-like regulatory domain-containing protein n=1 Tax=Rhodopirellula halodulae TaxID=2894198 RepID=UPI001E3A4609|nr:carboxypeptidase-like regulatory domain-containing protein [Rhodopirellula sp. JC737]MCC9656885.1 carboxypeptidase-like regulatory domain-containing protein [Rhodopirellula sp. JC737]
MKRFAAFFGMLAMTMTVAVAQDSNVKLNDHLTVPQWVNPAVEGELSGRLILPSADGSSETIAEATVVMTDASGKTIRTQTNESGEFTFADVAPGVYALSARADGIFACCAMHVVSDEMASSEVFPKTAEIAAAGIDYSIIKTSIIRYLPPAGKDSLTSIAKADLKSISSQVVGENLFRVAQNNGGMKGRIHMAGAEGQKLTDAGLLNIFLIHDGETIDRVVSNRDGSFEFANVDAGEYSILAIGLSGLGMAGFELVDEATANADTAMVNNKGETFVGFGSNDCCCCCTQFAMQVAPLPMAIEACNEVIIQESVVVEEGIVEDGMIVEDGLVADGFGGAVDAFGNPVDAFGNPIGGGGFAGGGYGGGFAGGGGGYGGGGFGGGLGGIASLAGLGIVAAALDDDDNNNVFPPQPASPAIP